MQETTVTTAKEQWDDILAYSERLGDLPLADLLEEAKRVSGISKEKMLITALAKRLECFVVAENLRIAMKMDCVKEAA